MKEETKHIATAINGSNPSVFEYLKTKGEYSYPTENVNVYAKAIASMNLGDLQAHAVDKGIRPTGDRRRLELSLINHFKQAIGKKRAGSFSRKITAEEIERAEKLRQKSLERSGNLGVIR